jgi:hypothetical protein
MTEEEIARIFDQVVQDLEHPRIHAVVAGAERRGVQIRRRRRAYAAAGSVLAVGALAVGGTAIAAAPRPPAAPGTPAAGRQAGQSAAHHSSPGKPGHPGSKRTAIIGPNGLPEPTPSPGPSTPQMTTKQIMDQLRAMLPASSTISDVRSDGNENVEFDYNDGQGAVDFIFWIAPLSFYQNPLTCSQSPWIGTQDEGPRPRGALPQSCVMTTLPDGSIRQDWVEYADAYGFYGYNVTDRRPDGTVVEAQIADGINHTLPQVDRAVPPGSFAEWNALVDSPVWHL